MLKWSHGALAAIAALFILSGSAHAQPGPAPGDGPPTGQPLPTQPPAPGPAPEAPSFDPDVLTCHGGWSYPLGETRTEIGPARFARQSKLQKDIILSSHAFGYCEVAARNKFSGKFAPVRGACNGLVALAGKVDVIGANLFRVDDKSSCDCLTSRAKTKSSCEGTREQLTTLRRYDAVLVNRAELVLANEVCASPERVTNSELRGACEKLDAAVNAHRKGGKVPAGQFALSAPVPQSVGMAIRAIAAVTDGRYLSVVPENFIGVRKSICGLPTEPVNQNQCFLSETGRVAVIGENKPGGGTEIASDKTGGELWSQKWDDVRWGMCNQLSLADVNANTCRGADVYIDERGQIHLNRPLTTRKQRKNATLCVDISDFDQNHPLMVTLGLDPTGSVPDRIWPGETMMIGDLINREVTGEDVMHIAVFGKARGVSLGEVLRVNAVNGFTTATRKDRGTRESNREACRIARSWVPVVDHEVPIGARDRQAVVPIKFGRGRDGETSRIDEDDYVVLWVRDIEPAGSVLVEYAQGQSVGYEPPPLLGGEVATSVAPGLGRDDLLQPGAALRQSSASVSEPLLPRRARYPGSRVLRLGKPAGNHSYDLKVCTRTGPPAGNPGVITADQSGKAQAQCSTADSLIVNERLFVHGDYHFGLRLGFGFSYFPTPDLRARRTQEARAAGDNVFEVVEGSPGRADYDVNVMLAVYPFGRDPRRFDARPWTKDYWKHAALTAGFTVRKLEVWEDFYLGASLPVANGVSLSMLSHFSVRDVPTDVKAGDLFMAEGAGDSIELRNFFDTQRAIAVGFSVGLQFDYDLFERAFIGIFDRLRGKQGQFLSSGKRGGGL